MCFLTTDHRIYISSPAVLRLLQQAVRWYGYFNVGTSQIRRFSQAAGHSACQLLRPMPSEVNRKFALRSNEEARVPGTLFSVWRSGFWDWLSKEKMQIVNFFWGFLGKMVVCSMVQFQIELVHLWWIKVAFSMSSRCSEWFALTSSSRVFLVPSKRHLYNLWSQHARVCQWFK